MPAPASQLVLHQTNQVFVDDSSGRQQDSARLAAREISAAAAAGAVAGVRAAMGDDTQVSPGTVAKSQTAVDSSSEAGSQQAVVVTIAAAAKSQRPAACNPKVPTGDAE